MMNSKYESRITPRLASPDQDPAKLSPQPAQPAQPLGRASKVLYMCSSFWLLGVESCDFSHAEKERTACKAEQIHKMIIIFTQNGPRLSFGVKIVVIL